MKLYGVGIDTVNILRFKNILNKNKNFKKRIFNQKELKYCKKKRKTQIDCLAKRFAAKEAFSKSLGTGFSKGLTFNEVLIENDKFDLIEKIKNQVPSAIFPELNSKLTCPALITAMSSRLEKTVSIDNGVMHMVGLAKKPMIVLFGPTNPKKFAPTHDGVKILDSKKIYKSNDINKISVEDVFKHI